MSERVEPSAVAHALMVLLAAVYGKTETVNRAGLHETLDLLIELSGARLTPEGVGS